MSTDLAAVTRERRRQPRLVISLPVSVKGHAASGAGWAAATRSEDASRTGCSFLLERPVLNGQVLLISLPLPRGLRRHDLMKPSYDTYAIVKSTRPCGRAVRVGVAFLGSTAPAGYEEAPGAVFRAERRSSPRQDRYVKIRLAGCGRASEATVLENVGGGGARVMTAQAYRVGELVAIESTQGSLRARCEVRGIHVGKDGIRRLSLRFVG